MQTTRLRARFDPPDEQQEYSELLQPAETRAQTQQQLCTLHPYFLTFPSSQLEAAYRLHFDKSMAKIDRVGSLFFCISWLISLRSTTRNEGNHEGTYLSAALAIARGLPGLLSLWLSSSVYWRIRRPTMIAIRIIRAGVWLCTYLRGFSRYSCLFAQSFCLECVVSCLFMPLTLQVSIVEHYTVTMLMTFVVAGAVSWNNGLAASLLQRSNEPHLLDGSVCKKVVNVLSRAGRLLTVFFASFCPTFAVADETMSVSPRQFCASFLLFMMFVFASVATTILYFLERGTRTAFLKAHNYEVEESRGGGVGFSIMRVLLVVAIAWIVLVEYSETYE